MPSGRKRGIRLTAPDYRFIFQKVVAESEARARKITAAPAQAKTATIGSAYFIRLAVI
jgi:hypothetical protein